MFSTTIIDVAIGVIFSFLAVSLVSSAVLEAISSALQWRANTLLVGVQKLVNDTAFTGLALQLYQHAAINPLGVDPAAVLNNNAVDLSSKPAYIASQQFAAAMTDLLILSDRAVQAGMPNAPIVVMKTAVVNALPNNPQISNMVNGVIDRSNGDLKQIEDALAAWFDNGMDRLSGAYKRRTQFVSFAIALLLAVVLNVDTFRIAHEVWDRPTLVDDLKLPRDAALKPCPPADPAQNATSLPSQSPSATVPSQAASSIESCQLSLNAQETLSILDKYLPVGWGDLSAMIHQSFGQWVLTCLGWLITAFATLFGAPFWFDTLQSVVRLKGTGPSPKETVDKRAAAA